MDENTIVYRTLHNPQWRDAINFLCDLLGCTRYRAARVIAAGIREGYQRQ